MGSNEKTAVRIVKCALVLSLATSFLLAVYVRFYSGIVTVVDLPVWPAYLFYLAASVVVWSVLETRLRLASTLFDEPSLSKWFGLVLQLGLLTLAIVSAGAFFWRDHSFSRYTIGVFWSLHFLFALGIGAVIRAQWFGRWGADEIQVWLATDHISNERLGAYLQGPLRKLTVRRFESLPALLKALGETASANANRQVRVALGLDQLKHFPETVRLLEARFERSGILVPTEETEHAKPQDSLFEIPTDRRSAETFDYLVSKRVVDLGLATVAAVLFTPVMLLTSLLIWLDLGRPIVLSQERVGRGGGRFRCYKFRTLAREALERSDSEWSVAPPTRLAAFLRATGLDELPQLCNVFRGEMSLVGPRPERPHFVERFQGELPFYSTRHRLQVGITGWAQVNDLRGDTSISRRVEYDLYYLNHWSLGFDLWILALTLAGFTRSIWSFAGTAGKTSDAGIV